MGDGLSNFDIAVIKKQIRKLNNAIDDDEEKLRKLLKGYCEDMPDVFESFDCYEEDLEAYDLEELKTTAKFLSAFMNEQVEEAEDEGLHIIVKDKGSNKEHMVVQTSKQYNNTKNREANTGLIGFILLGIIIFIVIIIVTNS